MQKTRQKTRHRHCFIFHVPTGIEGQYSEIKRWVKVVPGKRVVDLVLTADDVRRSMRANGIGNTQTCSMALCAKRQADSFPHSVEGYIDWQYSRAYVVSKTDRNGQLTECVAYLHSDNTAKLNDTKGGQRQLLAQLEKEGDRVIRLRPMHNRDNEFPEGQKKVTGRKTGGRSPQAVVLRGAQLRFANAFGGLAAPK